MQPATQRQDLPECPKDTAIATTCALEQTPCGTLLRPQTNCEDPPPAHDVHLAALLAQDAAQHAQPIPTNTATEPSSHAAVCPKLLKAYLPLVHQIVAQMARRLPANVLRDDLLAAGIFGLVDSLRRNSGNSGDGFEWYARTRIRGAIVDELRAQDWLTRRARAAVSRAQQADNSSPKPTTNVGLQDLSQGEEWVHLLAPDEDPEAKYAAKEEHRLLALAMAKLPERERLIIGLHYFEGQKFKDIGIQLQVSEPRVSQLHARALERLKTMFQEVARPRPRPARVA